MRSPILNTTFTGNVGPITNSEVKSEIEAVVTANHNNLQDSILVILKKHINDIDTSINTAFNESMEIIGVATEQSGEERNLSTRAQEINS